MCDKLKLRHKADNSETFCNILQRDDAINVWC